jgi:uncharacterized membrane protein YhaH (DUF805 family)
MTKALAHWRAWLSPAVICVGLAALIWTVFGKTAGYEFVNYDDGIYVYENPFVTSGITCSGIAWSFTHAHAGNWHPLTTMSHMLDCQLFGVRPGAHHLVNVGLHTVAAAVLFLAIRQMTGATWRSAFVSALFAIHPLHVESVAWIAERKDVLSGAFFALTLYAYGRYVRRPSIGNYFTMSILFALGLLSKPMLVTTPVLLLLLDYWPLVRLRDLQALRARIVEKVPLLILSAGSCVATLLAQRDSIAAREQLPLVLRLGNAAASYAIYLWQMLWPQKLAVFYPYPRVSFVVSLMAFALLTLISLAAVLVRRRFPYVFTGWFWYLGMLVPVIGVVQVGLQGHADRYTYLPQIGLYIVLTWLVVELLRQIRYGFVVLPIAATTVIAAFTARAAAQTAAWRNSESLWGTTLVFTHDNDVAHANLADLYLRQGKLEEAISHSRQALAIRPNNADAENNLALALRRRGDVEGAIAHWEKALQHNPHQLNAEFHLAWVLATSPQAQVRDGARAVQLMQDLLQHANAGGAMVLRTLAAAYAEAGRFSEAMTTAQSALELAVRQNDSGLAEDLRLNIANYQAHLPLRDPSLSNVSLPP